MQAEPSPSQPPPGPADVFVPPSRAARPEARAGHRLEPCDECDGRGHRVFSKKQLDAFEARVAREARPDERDKLRKELQASARCDKCHGAAVVQRPIKGQVSICDDCDGDGCVWCGYLGEVALGPIDELFTTTRCPRCAGTGARNPWRAAYLRRFPDAVDQLGERAVAVKNSDSGPCLLCRGATYVIPCTVRAGGPSKQGAVGGKSRSGAHAVPSGSSAGAVVSSDAWIQRYGDLGTQAWAVERLRHDEPALADAADAYFGVDGDIYAPTAWGRGFALWWLTEHGRRLLAGDSEDEAPNPFDRPLQVIASLRLLEDGASRPNTHRRVLLARTGDEARQLEARMHTALRSLDAR
jgi:hypothetical protein